MISLMIWEESRKTGGGEKEDGRRLAERAAAHPAFSGSTGCIFFVAGELKCLFPRESCDTTVLCFQSVCIVFAFCGMFATRRRLVF